MLRTDRDYLLSFLYKENRNVMFSSNVNQQMTFFFWSVNIVWFIGSDLLVFSLIYNALFRKSNKCQHLYGNWGLSAGENTIFISMFILSFFELLSIYIF